MNKILLCIIAIVSYSFNLFAQTPPQRTCGTLQHHQYLQQTRPNYTNELNQYNQIIEQYLLNKAANAAAGRTTNTTLTPTIIPVVVHVVYANATQSISLAQAISQVQVLNDDFAKLNSDAIKVTQPTFSTVASGANIRFCLAQRDPNGNPTTGVDYKLTTTASFSTNDNVKHASTGGADPWDVTKYVNIWVCNLGSTLLGYGEFPTTSISQTWGLVLHYKYTGSGGSAIAPYNLGRTGTHEFGHCFNLLHIWGDDGTACTGTDQCSDTPNQAGEHYGCFTQGSIQTDACSPSSPGTMWMNYMDYTDDACMYMFTAQQVARMEAVVSTAPWNVLQTSLGCTPVSSLDAGILNIMNPISNTSNCNNNITPKISLNNSGSNTLTSAIINYKMDALPTQTLSWSGSLASGTSTVLTLNTYTGLSVAAHTFSVWVSSPNGGVDQNASNNSLAATFTVIAAPVGQTLPFMERFDATTFPPTGWVKSSQNVVNAATTWSRLANATGIPVVPTTSACAKMDNFSSATDITGQKDILQTPALNLTGANSTLKLKFDVSHRVYNTITSDSLNVYISTDCGSSWVRLYTKGGAQLATVAGALTSAYTPTTNAQWRRDSVSLSAYVGQPSVYLKFESRSAWGNNLYLDNVNVLYTPSNNPPVASFSTTANKCAGSSFTLSDQSTNNPTSWLWYFPGALTPTTTVQNPSVTYTASGVYTVTLISANSSGTSTPVSQTITINPNPAVSVTNATVCSGNSASLIATGATTYSWNTGVTTASVSVTPLTTTVYTVVGTTNGCTNTKTLSVTVKNTPTVAIASSTICSGNFASLIATGATTYIWNTGATTASLSVNPTVTSVYTVTGTTNGCSNTKTLSVTVKTTPTVSATNTVICSGNFANLVATGATTYSWSTGALSSSISVNPATTTVYTVTGTTLGCIDTKTVNVLVNPKPVISALSPTICVGTTTNIIVSGGLTYSWNTGATTSSITVTPTLNTTYTLVATNSVGCSNTKTISVIVNPLPNISVNSTTICAGSTATLVASGANSYLWNTGASVSTITVNPTTTTNYTVTGTSALGCVKSKIVNVVVANAPAISVNSSTICAGSSATLVASGVTSYTWSSGLNTSSVTVNPTSTTVYTVSGSLNGCTSVATKTTIVTVNPLPSVTLGSITNQLCVNSNSIILSGSPAGGTYSGTGVVGASFSPALSGAGTFTLSYLYTNSNGCSARATQTVNVSLCTGIVDFNANSIFVYPNPTKDVVSITTDPLLVNHLSFEIYNSIGQLIISEKVKQSTITVSLNDYSKGMYTVRFFYENKQHVIKLIKE